jgi:hypothetical protein
MDSEQTDTVQSAANQVMELEAELEVASNAALAGAVLEKARADLHAWIDTVKGVVVSPGLGRVTLIHQNGRLSTISSPDLPFAMSAPVDEKPTF